jgi:cellulose synthase/poly-beta-1,6-N-acetylglucosamine synthase-like glycosyltransferase
MEDLSSEIHLFGGAASAAHRRRLGMSLVSSGRLHAYQLALALAEHQRLGVPLGQVLVSHGHLSETQLHNALARQWGWRRADLRHDPPDPALIRKTGLARCQNLGCVPWKSRRGVVLLACESPGHFDQLENQLEGSLGLMLPVAASRGEILDALAQALPAETAYLASHRVPEGRSSRPLAYAPARRFGIVLAIVGLLAALFTIAAMPVFLTLTLCAVLLSLCTAALKAAAYLAHFFAPTVASVPVPRPPPVSLMVPLFHEKDILHALIMRLAQLDYPKPLLQILLLVEEEDATTRAKLAKMTLPPWFRIVVVPDGQPRTKPRALNHALPYCTGEIIGIYDAEDAPGPGQIQLAVKAFEAAPPDVACVQGVLEFYNPKANWLARCFSLDYAAWFRVILPGWARLGLPVPLGGTTLFLRREAITALHGWDAHNVTEDADLGLRLARAGFKTRLIPSVTGEEANSHTWRWIRQRSRWIKGYMVTYWTHMRHPLRCVRDLGVWPFLGFQVLFLGTMLHFLVAPLLWSFWLAVFGLPHPFFDLLPKGVGTAAAIAFLSAEVSGMAILATAAIRAKRFYLLPWIPTMSLYFLLAVPAGIKALLEFVWSPVYWDKTDHGHSLMASTDQEASRSASDFRRVTKAFEI